MSTEAYATAAQYRTITGKAESAYATQILTDLKGAVCYLESKLGERESIGLALRALGRKE